MTISVDMAVGQVTVFLISIARWDDDSDKTITSGKANEIADNIRRALESQGQEVNFVP